MLSNANALRLPLPDKSVQAAIMSPPYWGLRDYGVQGQLGLEATPEEYVANLGNEKCEPGASLGEGWP